MGRIRTRLGRQEAIRRLITVMQAEYANEISDLQNQSEVNDDLPLPAPAARDYYEGFVDPEDTIFSASGGGVAVYITNEGPRTLLTSGSAGPSGVQETRSLSLAGNILFRVEQYNTNKLQLQDDNGNDVRPFTPDEVMRLRAERYIGAMDETVRKYASDGDHIHDIEMTDDTAGLMPVEEDFGPIGIAAAMFEITQQTEGPRMQQLP